MWKAETKIMVVTMKWHCKIRNLKENGKMHSGVPELRTYNRNTPTGRNVSSTISGQIST
jgi:hypothetical protein